MVLKFSADETPPITCTSYDGNPSQCPARKALETPPLRGEVKIYEWRWGGLKEVNGGTRGTYVILSKIKNCSLKKIYKWV